MMSLQSWLISSVVRLSRVGPKVWVGGCSGGGSLVSSKVGGGEVAMVCNYSKIKMSALKTRKWAKEGSLSIPVSLCEG